jgi:hypothetical protein
MGSTRYAAGVSVLSARYAFGQVFTVSPVLYLYCPVPTVAFLEHVCVENLSWKGRLAYGLHYCNSASNYNATTQHGFPIKENRKWKSTRSK